jgi:MerR family transcriptional regulator, mercuric resistance operon regulatory protein
MRARELGFTLDEIRTLLKLSCVSDAQTCGNAKALAGRHLAHVRSLIRDLRRMEGVLAGDIRQCDAGKTVRCPLIDTLLVGSR